MHDEFSQVLVKSLDKSLVKLYSAPSQVLCFFHFFKKNKKNKNSQELNFNFFLDYSNQEINKKTVFFLDEE